MSLNFNVCIFCGSKEGKNLVYRKTAQEIGYLLASEKMGLIYGAGNTGLMGEVSYSVHRNGGVVHAIIPQFLKDMEGISPNIDKISYTETLHERKIAMIQDSDGFIVLPGGLGTLDELSEVIALKQIGKLNKPIILINCGHWADNFIALLKSMKKEGFLTQNYEYFLNVVSEAREAIHILKNVKNMKKIDSH